MKDMTLSEELRWRGFVNQTTFKDIKILDSKPITFYFGVDPSSDSMQVGNLATAIMVKHFINAGHKAILLVGGATGMIGDPDGKSNERELKSLEEVAKNKAGIADQYKTVFASQKFELVDNYDWFKNINFLDFLRDIGKHVPMRQMLGRDFVQSRLGEDGNGISYAEFSYSLIQGYDFLHLFRKYGATLQVCGADQWGNSIAGVELLRRIEGVEANVFSAPLIINKSTGIKFGKSESGAIWLDENKTSVYQFYQFWLNVDDEGVIDYIKIYTLLSKKEIDKIIHTFNNDRASRLAQKTLAYEVTKLVHGQNRADCVKRISEALFKNLDYNQLKPQDFNTLAAEIGLHKTASKNIIDLLVLAKLAKSKSEARRFINSGAVYINGQPICTDKQILENKDYIGNYLILKRGKNLQTVIKRED